MSAGAQHINVQLVHINGHLTKGLYRIGMEQIRLAFLCNGTDFLNGFHGTDLVVGKHDTD